MKIKECIKLGVEPCVGDIPPIRVPYFLIHMAAILALGASQLAAEDFPTITIGGEKSGGKGTENNVLPAVRVLLGIDMARQTTLFQQTYGFFKWFIEQEAPDDTTNGLMKNAIGTWWYDHDFLGKKWNEYAAMEEAKK